MGVRRSITSGVTFFIAGLLGAGCSSSAPLDQDTFRTQLDQALCDYGVRCPSRADFDVACHPQNPDLLFSSLVTTAPRTQFDSAQARSCLRETREASENCAPPGRFREACRTVWKGTAARDGACAFHFECAPGLYCAPEDDPRRTLDCSGACAPRRNEGADCASDHACAPELACRGGTCTRLATDDEPCSSNSECAAGLFCDTLVDECVPIPEILGSACGRARMPGDRCPVPYQCVRGTCELSPLGDGPGDSCDPSSPSCPDGFHCAEGTCEPLPVAGEPCDTARPCFEGQCMDGTCRLIATGEPCSHDPARPDPCRDGYCDEEPQTCQPILDEGEPCNDDAACGSDAFCIAATPSAQPRCTPIDICSM